MLVAVLGRLRIDAHAADRVEHLVTAAAVGAVVIVLVRHGRSLT